MGRFILQRLLHAVPTLWVVATLTFFMVRLAPGGPFTAERRLPPEVLAALNAHYGLDRPMWRQYLDYLGHLAVGDLGPSYRFTSHTVNEIIAMSFPVSLQLGLLALAVASALGVPIGLVVAMRPRLKSSAVLMGVATLGICLPTFVMGPLLARVFGVELMWFNVAGFNSLQDLVLPALTLGCYYAAYVARLTRAGMLEVLNQDYIRTARAKGASEVRVVLVHGLRGGLLPLVAFLGPAVAGLITGSFVVETLFLVPGLGQFFVKSALNRDYFLVCGTVLFYALLIVVMNLVSDIAQAWMDPRIRLEGGRR